MASIKSQMLASSSLIAVMASEFSLRSLVEPRLVGRGVAYPFDPSDQAYVVLAPVREPRPHSRPRRVSFAKREDAETFIRNVKHYNWGAAYEGAFCVK